MSSSDPNAFNVMAGEPFALDPPEHIGKIEVAGAGLQMNLMAVAEAIGEPHLLDPAHIDRIDKPGQPFRYEVRMVGRERKLECRELDTLEVSRHSSIVCAR
jgi:hypothetical protein